MKPRKHNPMCPSHGVLKGGTLDGQRYAFLRVEVTPDLNTLLHLRVSDGVWPFPRDVAVPLDQLYGVQFMPIKGDRARRFNIDSVMEAAHVAYYEAATAGAA